MKKLQNAVLIAVAILILLTGCTTVGPAEENWQEAYLEQATMSGIDQKYFEHTNLIDSDEDIQVIASQISAESVNAKDAIRNTLEWVYQNIEYTRKTSATECFGESATEAVRFGRGDCVTMTKATVSLLREQGIAARPAGGCISGNFACGVLFSINPGRAPRYEPIDLDDPKKRGGLHEWLEIWVPGQGWVIGEATSGQLFSKSCSSYDTKDYSTDSYGMCIITDTNYVSQCRRF